MLLQAACGVRSAAYPSVSIRDRYCLPAGSEEAAARAQVDQYMRKAADGFLDVIGRIIEAKKVLLLSLASAIVLGYLYLFLLRAIARCIIPMGILVSVTSLVMMGLYLWRASKIRADQKLQQTFRVLAICAWFVSLSVLGLGACFRSAAKLSAKCIRQAAKVIWRMPCLLLMPLGKIIVRFVLLALLLFGFFFLMSTGDVTGLGNNRSFSYTFHQKLLMCAYIFCSYWLFTYISALYYFSIAYAVAQHYVADVDEVGHREVECCGAYTGVKVGLKYHTGSLAYGSAIIAVLEMLQRPLEWARKQSKAEELGPCVNCLFRALMCACKCVEGILRFINKNAYINIALTSQSFCQAVQSVVRIVAEHGAAMAILNGATFVFQFVGIASITSLCGLFSAYLVGAGLADENGANLGTDDPVLAVVASCAIAFMVAWAFMSIFDVASDTLLICHAEDMSRYGGHRAQYNRDVASLYAEAEKQVAGERARAVDDCGSDVDS
eukprot:TRINITY_DN18947_c0_g1_i1.p1 TRINITY_DN18947_c0_g1~~TRINITY_DN18947_c0_g1_i1.p1  ORF type:complete len:494 (-),score=72.54 TRINITY_DN18947_c0_g1_i1:159-1640(-)